MLADDQRPDKPKTAPETETALAFLDWQRATLVAKLAGLSKEDATKRLVPSLTTILGIVKHLAQVEAWWFQDVFLGREIEYPWTDDDPDADFRIEPDETVESIVELYESKVGASRAAVAGFSLDQLSVREVRDTRRSLRWIVLHMIEETARHVGQVDILRELTDGATGE